MSLHDQIVRVRHRLADATKKRHDAKPGGDRRAKLAARVLRLKHRLEALLDQKRPKPDFNGHPANVSKACRQFIRRANQAGLYVTATTDGVHSPTSYHYRGLAVDVAAPMTADGIVKMRTFQADEVRRGSVKYNELFGPNNELFVKNGVRYTIREGDPLENQHDNHVHGAPRS